MEQQDQLVKMVPMVYQVSPDNRVSWVSRGLLELLDQKDLPELLDFVDQLEQMVKMEHLEPEVEQALQDPPERVPIQDLHQ